jgi:hypothetical protein
MIGTETLIWIILAATVVVCVLSILGVFASIIRHETDLHDLRNRVSELQYRYTLQLARLHGHIEEEADGQVDIVEDDAAESGPRLAA